MPLPSSKWDNLCQSGPPYHNGCICGNRLLGANTLHMRSSTMVALDPARRGRKTSRPLRLWMRLSIRLLLLSNSRCGPRWSANPLLWLLLSFYLCFHSLHASGLFHQGREVLDGKRGYHQSNVSSKTILKLSATSLLI